MRGGPPVSIRVSCPHCQATNVLSARKRGKNVECNKCHQFFFVPSDLTKASRFRQLE